MEPVLVDQEPAGYARFGAAGDGRALELDHRLVLLRGQGRAWRRRPGTPCATPRRRWNSSQPQSENETALRFALFGVPEFDKVALGTGGRVKSRSGLVSRHEVSGRGRGGRLVRVSRDCIRATAMAVWLPSVLVLVWCAMVAGPDVLAVAQTSARRKSRRILALAGAAPGRPSRTKAKGKRLAARLWMASPECRESVVTNRSWRGWLALPARSVW